MDQTLRYYENNAAQYHERNRDRNLSDGYDLFLKHVKGRSILDFGCGTGRDARYFTDCGYSVVGVDGSKEMLAIARKECPAANFQCIDFKKPFALDGQFDGIWACASLLHFTDEEFEQILGNISPNLKSEGVIHLALKVCDYSRDQDDRYFNYWTGAKLQPVVTRLGFKIIAQDESDYRKSRWLSALLSR